ncbi:Inositol-1,4,5-trisphosphate 5-phosphatase 1 [Candidozyma auris]
MKVLLREEPRTIALVSDTHALTFRQQTSPAESSKRSSSVEVQLEKAANFQHNRDYKVLIHRDLHGCLGLIELDKQIYVALISGASINVARPVPYESVDNIYSVDFVSLSSNDWDFVNLDSAGMPLQTQDPDEFDPNSPRVVHPCFELKKLLSNGSFYFSNDFDLTSSVQKRGVDATKFAKGVKDSEKAASITRVNLSHYEEQYMWNSFMMEELFKFRANLDEVAVEILDHNRFLTTVIRGFAKTVRLNSRGITSRVQANCLGETTNHCGQKSVMIKDLNSNLVPHSDTRKRIIEMANYQITLSDESKETINKVLDYSRTVAHYGFIPFILYLGWQGTPNKPNLLNLLSPIPSV